MKVIGSRITATKKKKDKTFIHTHTHNLSGLHYSRDKKRELVTEYHYNNQHSVVQSESAK